MHPLLEKIFNKKNLVIDILKISQTLDRIFTYKSFDKNEIKNYLITPTYELLIVTCELQTASYEWLANDYLKRLNEPIQLNLEIPGIGLDVP